MSVDLLLRGGFVFTMDPARSAGESDVLVRGSRIAAVGPNLEVDAPVEIIDARGFAVLPGLIHAHLHLCQVLFRHQAEDRELLPWLRERIWPLEAAHDPASLRVSAELGIAELLRSGTTAALDMGTVRHHDVVFEAARDLGFRLRSGKSMMDAGDDVPAGLRESTSESLSESDRLRARWEGAAEGRLTYAYAPRFVPSCTDELLNAVADRLKAGAHLHTHASENLGEIALVRRLTGAENIEHLHRLGLLGPRSTLAHGVHLADGERELLATTGTSIAHCPSANLKLASGIADVPALLQSGVNVGLGADGAPCNNNLDLWREMKLAGLLPRLKHGPSVLTPERILEMATLGGARALGLSERVGSLEPGKQADVILVDLRGPHLQPLTDSAHDIATALVYAAHASDVHTVLIDGRRVVRNGQLVGVDTDDLGRRAREQLERVRKRAGL